MDREDKLWRKRRDGDETWRPRTSLSAIPLEPQQFARPSDPRLDVNYTRGTRYRPHRPRIQMSPRIPPPSNDEGVMEDQDMEIFEYNEEDTPQSPDQEN